MLNIRMLNNNVLVDAVEIPREINEGGIVIPNPDFNKLRISTVRAVGNHVKDYKVGRDVIIAKGAGMPFERDGKKYLILKDTEIIGEHYAK